jgi:hypothetical protein
MAKVMVINQIDTLISSGKMSNKMVKSSIIKTCNILLEYVFQRLQFCLWQLFIGVHMKVLWTHKVTRLGSLENLCHFDVVPIAIYKRTQ